MASHTKALLRKWARYEGCTACNAVPGEPCRRKIPMTWRYRDNDTILTNAHRGRARNKARCNDSGGRALRIGSTFACCLVPDHGGEFHRNWHGQEWPVRTSEAAV